MMKRELKKFYKDSKKRREKCTCCRQAVKGNAFFLYFQTEQHPISKPPIISYFTFLKRTTIFKIWKNSPEGLKIYSYL